MTFKELIYRRAALIGEGYTTDAEMDAMWQQDKEIAEMWFDNLWRQRQADFNKQSAAIVKDRDKQMEALRPAIVKALAPSGGWKARPDAYRPEADREADKYRIKSAKEIAEYWSKKRLAK